MKTSSGQTEAGFTLIEVLVAAVIFAGVFLLLFSLLGKVLSNSSGVEQMRVTGLAEARLASFHEQGKVSRSEESVEIDGIAYLVLNDIWADNKREFLRMSICRELTWDTVATFYAVRYVRQE